LNGIVGRAILPADALSSASTPDLERSGAAMIGAMIGCPTSGSKLACAWSAEVSSRCRAIPTYFFPPHVVDASAALVGFRGCVRLGDTVGIATSVTVSSQIVRAWFDTVLNPLIRALTTEADVLARGNLTWKTEVQRLASLVPVREHLVEETHPNFEQMLSLHPEFNAPIAEHDRRLAPLAAACLRLQEALTEVGSSGKHLTALSRNGRQTRVSLNFQEDSNPKIT